MGDFRVNGIELADCDKNVVATPLEGKNANIPFVFETVTSLKYKSEGDSEGIGQTGSPAKSALVVTESESDIELEISLGERMEFTQHLGPGAGRIRCTVKCIWQRQGLKTMVVETGDGKGKPGGYCLFTKGIIGAETDNKSKPSCTIGGKCTDLMENGVSAWQKPPQ